MGTIAIFLEDLGAIVSVPWLLVLCAGLAVLALYVGAVLGVNSRRKDESEE
jgi:hypothetical protein